MDGYALVRLKVSDNGRPIVFAVEVFQEKSATWYTEFLHARQSDAERDAQNHRDHYTNLVRVMELEVGI